MTDIPACKNCSYYYEFDEFIGFCKFHTFSRPDYINGKINNIHMIAFQAREQEDRCGPEGKDFVQREEEEKNEPFSYRKWLKGFFTTPKTQIGV
jgi:hypothetical protein